MLLTAPKARAGGSTVFLYFGPRASVTGSVISPIGYSPAALRAGGGTYQVLARLPASRSAALAATLRLPTDTAYGMATILAFQEHCLRCKAEAEWKIPVTARDPDLAIDGTPGQQVVIADGDASSGAVASDAGCGMTLDPNGAAIIHRVTPGVHTVISQRPAGSLASQVLVLLPNSSAAIHLHLPNLTTKCSTIQVNSVMSAMSGREGALSGSGPFGYFLSGVPITDSLLIKASQSGRALTSDLLKQTYIELITPDGTVVQHSPIVGATSPSKAAAWGNLTLDPTQLQLLIGPGSRLQGLLGQITNTVGQDSTLGIDYNPGQLPVGTNHLRIGISDCIFDYDISMIDSGWRGPLFALSAPATFNPRNKTYHAAGTLPPNAPNIDEPFDPGWDKYGPLPAYHLHIDNKLKAGIFIDERFTTAGHWQANQAQAVLLAEVLSQNLVDQSLDLGSNNRDPRRPGYGLDETDLIHLNYDPVEPLVSIPIYGFRIPHIGGIGFTFDVYYGASGRVFFSGYVNPDLSINQLTLGAEVGFYIRGGLGITLFVGGVNIGLQASFFLTVPLTFSSGGGPPDASVCFTGEVSFGVTWWYDVWLYSDSGDLFPRVPITTFHIPGGCSRIMNQDGLRAHLLRHMLLPPPVMQPASRTMSPMAVSRAAAGPRHPHPASPVVRFDQQGHGISAWVRSEPAKKRDTLVAAPSIGGRWGTPATVATSNAAILSPRLAELGDGRAVLSWVQNMAGPADIQAMAAAHAAGDTAGMLQHMIDRQEIFTSAYSGGRWSAPRQMTNDQVLDNDPTLAADQVHHRAALIWTRGNESKARGLVVSTFNGATWSPITGVPGTLGTNPRSAAATASGATYTVAWVRGSETASTVALASLTRGRWTSMRAPALPTRAQDLTLGYAGKRLVVAASILPAGGSNMKAEEPAIWSATLKGNAWVVQRVAPFGDSPSLGAGTGSPTILTFRRPVDPGIGAGGLGEIVTAALLPGGRFSRAIVIAHGASDFAHPSGARRPGATMSLLYQALQPDPGLSDVSGAPHTLKPARVTTLDSIAGIQSAVLHLAGHPLLDLRHAKLSVPHPRPGSTLTLSVPLINTGAGSVTATGTLTIHSGKKVLARVAVRRNLGPYAVSAVLVSVRAGSAPITLRVTSITASKGKELGLPLRSTRLVASPNTDGSVALRWVQPADHDIASYHVYRRVGKSFNLIGLASTPLYVDTDTAGNQHASYAVTAVDKQGRESLLSVPATVAKALSTVR